MAWSVIIQTISTDISLFAAFHDRVAGNWHTALYIIGSPGASCAINLVLYSRLRLLTSSKALLRWVLAVILAIATFMVVPTIIGYSLSENNNYTGWKILKAESYIGILQPCMEVALECM
jgi:hypothetical protein